MGMADKIDRELTRTLEVLVTVLAISIAALVFFGACLRYVFNYGVYGTDEITNLLFIHASTLGAALGVRNRDHIKVTIFLEKAPIGLLRALCCVVYALVAAFNAWVGILSINWINRTLFVYSQVTGLPFWIGSIALPISCGLCVLYCLHNLVRLIKSDAELRMEIGGDLEYKGAMESLGGSDGKGA
jgi:TRAP-type C4-dicarboxylate transport system permease small subunit